MYIIFIQLQRNILATSPRVTKFPIDWGDGNNEEEMTTEDSVTAAAAEVSTSAAAAVKDDMSESNQIPLPGSSLPTAAATSDYNSKHSLGIGHDSNSLNLAEPMAS